MNDRINKGAIYMTYQWWIGKADSLTIDELDAEGSFTPESKYCAVQVYAVEDQEQAALDVQAQYMDLKEYLSDAVDPQYDDHHKVQADFNEPAFPAIA